MIPNFFIKILLIRRSELMQVGAYDPTMLINSPRSNLHDTAHQLLPICSCINTNKTVFPPPAKNPVKNRKTVNISTEIEKEVPRLTINSSTNPEKKKDMHHSSQGVVLRRDSSFSGLDGA